MHDTERDTYNVSATQLYPNLSNADTTFITLDFLSNGIKVRTSNAGYNGSTNIIVGIAFAEHPFKYSNAR